MKPIELTKPQRADAIASIQQYFEENLPEPIGQLPAGLLLDYFLEEIGPAVYNQAIHDAQTRMIQRASDLPRRALRRRVPILAQPEIQTPPLTPRLTTRRLADPLTR